MESEPVWDRFAERVFYAIGWSVIYFGWAFAATIAIGPFFLMWRADGLASAALLYLLCGALLIVMAAVGIVGVRIKYGYWIDLRPVNRARRTAKKPRQPSLAAGPAGPMT